MNRLTFLTPFAACTVAFAAPAAAKATVHLVPAIAFAFDPLPLPPDAGPVSTDCTEAVDGVAVQECPPYMVTSWTLTIYVDQGIAVYEEERCDLTREFERSVTFGGSVSGTLPFIPVEGQGAVSRTETEVMCTYGECGTFNHAGVPGGLFGHSGQ